MFEGIICGFIVFAVGYVGFMRLMARRADVLHGEFIQSDDMHRAHAAASIVAMIQHYVQVIRQPARH
jgi:hypothetical protein